MNIDREDYIKTLVTVFLYETSFCSTYGHARRIGCTADRLVELGEEVVPALLAAIPEGGMHVMHMLGEITGEWPSKSADNPIEGTVFMATNVAQAKDLWLAWGKDKGLI